MEIAIKHKSTSSQYSNIEERTNAPISYVKGAKSNKIIGPGRLIEVFQAMKDDENLKSFSERLESLKENNDPGYSTLKEKECPGFVIGTYKVRKDDACKEYVPLIGFDIDKGEDLREVMFLIADCKSNPYIFAAFPSPSKRGVRILMWCDSTKETHKEYYAKACEYLSKALKIPTSKQITIQKKAEGLSRDEIKEYLLNNIHIDQGTSNISRIWFYTHNDEKDIYLNVESEVFKVDLSKPSKRPPSPLKVIPQAKTLSLQEKFVAIEKMTDQRFFGTGRNDRLLLLCCLLFEHGVSKSHVANYCLKFEEDDFGTSEIEKIINNADKRADHGKYSDIQLLNYLDKLESNQSQSKDYEISFEAIDSTHKKDNQIEPQTTLENKSRKKVFKVHEVINYLLDNYDFRRNIVACQVECRKIGTEKWVIVNDHDLILECMEEGIKGVKGLVEMILGSRKYIKNFDPFVDYFKTLPKWDPSHPDHIDALGNYIKAKDQAWFKIQFKKMLVRLVAQAMNIIPFNKQVFVLIGKQNDGKSTFLRYLCPKSLKGYFKENLEMNSKDGRIALSQNLIINLDELANFGKHDKNKQKAFITIDQVKERIPYDKTPTTLKRKASFFGSTNSDDFLRDVTGSVRWLIFEIKGINHDNGGPNGYTHIDMDLVYSQAYYLLNSGFKFKLDDSEIKKSEKRNKQFYEVTIEQELIEEFYSPGADIPECDFMGTKEIVNELVLEYRDLKVWRIGKALKLLGFKRVQKYDKDTKTQKRGYFVKRLKPQRQNNI